MSFSFTPTQATTVDSIASFLFKSIRVLLVGLIFLLPIIWLQPAFLLLLPTKTFMLALTTTFVVIIGSLAVLRQTSLNISLHAPVLAWWAIVAVAAVSALFAPSYLDSLVGFSMGIHTVAFLGMLGVLMLAMSVFRDSKQWSLLSIAAMVAPIVIIALLHIIRFIFGEDFLTLGVLNSTTDTLVGSWNDLGILSAIVVSMLMVTLVQLPLPKISRIVSVIAMGLLLVVLAVINFSVLWYGLGLFALALLLYVLTRDRMVADQDKPSLIAILVMTVVALVSILFIVAGGSIGGFLSASIGTNYVEVRPSFGSTLEVTQQSLSKNLLFGAGPNQFSEAWRSYRDVSINETVFWNVGFLAGHSYISSWFVTTGILGILAWLIFIVLFFYSGVRVLLLGSGNDRFWFYVATISFLVAASVWLISLVYVPGTVVLVYGAIATGLLFASARPLGVTPLVSCSALANQRTSLVFIVTTLVFVIGSVGFGYLATKQFTATATYASVFNIPDNEDGLDLAVERIISAFTIFPRDVYLREIVDLRLAQAYNLLSVENPSESEQRLFEEVITSSIEVAAEAVRLYPLNAFNWLTLGNVYQALGRAGVEGAADRAIAAYTEAINREPKNPEYHLQIAVARASMSDAEGVREAIRQALQLKSNYFDAYVLLSELEILSGNTTDAISATRSLVALEPRNAGLYYRLGVLHLADENLEDSVGAFSDALRFDPQFANARYVRALVYAQLGNRTQAISELEIVRSQNEANVTVDEVIALIRDENVTISALELITPIQEPAPITTQQDVVLGDGELGTDLFSPVNTMPIVPGRSENEENNIDDEASEATTSESNETENSEESDT